MVEVQGNPAHLFDEARALMDMISERVFEEFGQRWGDQLGYELLDDEQQADPEGRTWPVGVRFRGFDLDVDIEVKVAVHCPPGWESAPAGPGCRVSLSGAQRGHEFEVLAVLGDNDDPRPGYRLQLDERYHRDVSEAERGPFVVSPHAVTGVTRR